MCRPNSFENNLSRHRPWLHQKSPRPRHGWCHQHNQQPLWRRQLLCIHGVRKITSRRAEEVSVMSVHCRYGSPAYLSSHQEAVTQSQHRSSSICSLWKTSVMQGSCSLLNDHSFTARTWRANYCWSLTVTSLTDSLVKMSACYFSGVHEVTWRLFKLIL